MVEDFSTQFSLLYLPMKYLAIISRYPVYVACLENNDKFSHSAEWTKLREKIILQFWQ